MKTSKQVTQALVSAGCLRNDNADAAAEILAKYYADAVDAADTRAFARKDMDYQTQVIADAEDLAEIDIDMGEVEDRFVQAEFINIASDLSENDQALFGQADAMIVAACTEAAMALSAAGLIAAVDLEATTRLIASLWLTNARDEP
jgi:hypothetical protein